MPITEKERDQLTTILTKMDTAQELMRLTGLIYDTILKAQIKSESLMAVGKLIFARVSWADLPAQWITVTTNPRQLHDEAGPVGEVGDAVAETGG